MHEFKPITATELLQRRLQDARRDQARWRQAAVEADDGLESLPRALDCMRLSKLAEQKVRELERELSTARGLEAQVRDAVAEIRAIFDRWQARVGDDLLLGGLVREPGK